MLYSIIIACCLNGGIGYDNRIPWNIKEEMKLFKRITTGDIEYNGINAVIMGRNTWESLPNKPLQNRNLPLIGIWVKLLKIPYRLLYPAILVFCCIGVYTVNNSTFDVFITAGFGVIGYMFFKFGCEPAPLLLGFVLGPMMEENFRRALLLSRGDFTTFLTRPLSLGLLLAAAFLVVIVALPAIKKSRQEVFTEEL